MDDTDLILRNQVAMMSGIAALLDKTGKAKKLAADLDDFALETAAHLGAKLNPFPDDLVETAADVRERRRTPT